MLKVQVNKDVQDFSKKITDFIEVRSFLAVYEFILKSGVYPKTDAKGWFNTLTYMHTKGWLYLNTDKGQINCVVGAYRVKDLNNFDTLPEVEEGSILYVPFAASTSDDKLILRTMLDSYLKSNPEVKEIVFFEQNNDDKFKRFNVEVPNGQ